MCQCRVDEEDERSCCCCFKLRAALIAILILSVLSLGFTWWQFTEDFQYTKSNSFAPFGYLICVISLSVVLCCCPKSESIRKYNFIWWVGWCVLLLISYIVHFVTPVDEYCEGEAKDDVLSRFNLE